MPDYTYLQAAQPTTAGHWLLSHAYPALRDAERIERDFAAVNRSPAGTGGVNGSRFPLDRERLAQLLGFDGADRPTRATRTGRPTRSPRPSGTPRPRRRTRAASPRTSSSTPATSSACSRIGDEFCRASALMPQKRNPYALVVIRGAAGTLLGRATGVLATQRTPSGRTDNLLYAYGEVAGAIELATRARRPRRGGRREPAGRRARDAPPRGATPPTPPSCSASSSGLDYRSAYKQVGARGRRGHGFDAAASDDADRHAHGHRRRRARADGRDARRDAPRRSTSRGRAREHARARDRSAPRRALLQVARGSRSSVS